MNRDEKYYDSHAQDVDLEKIASSDDNRELLRMLRSDYCWDSLHITDVTIQRNSDDLGWLGYFVGKSACLNSFTVDYLPEERERTNALFGGFSRNRSISELCITTDIGVDNLIDLGCFLRDNIRLDQLELRNVDLGIERAHTFALGSTSIRKLHFGENNLGDDGFASIAAALSKQTQLERLSLRDNSLGATSCKALEPMVSIFPRLSYLDLSFNIIDDTGLEALVGGLSKSNSLEELNLSGNRLITVEGLRSFSTLFRSENCSLKSLTLEEMNIGDDEAEVCRWTRRAEPFLDYQDPGIECRKLAAMYKFMRVMPQLVADGYWAHVLKETLEKKRKLLLELDALDETEKSARKRVKH
ncbi:leucine-rich repeat protein [Skeletonema marinoi]|uniref:Leucine-rich repeat protein n=1 Tax=Skeletonema marinoi TaxID=267567 RepID=A0AAD9D4C4_9STRA|nr:leucine-rich repeat protein [Skeletonema marinoi]